MASKRKQRAPAAKRRKSAGAPAAEPEMTPATAPVAAPSPADDIVRLESSLQIRDVGALRARLLAAIARGRLVIDAREVIQVDTAGLQLLVAAAKSMANKGGQIEFKGVADCLIVGANALDLHNALEIPWVSVRAE
jgi:anti-anti-sigma regulatory factor